MAAPLVRTDHPGVYTRGSRYVFSYRDEHRRQHWVSCMTLAEAIHQHQQHTLHCGQIRGELDREAQQILKRAHRAKLADSRATGGEAYSLVRKALQATDRAARTSGTPTAKRLYTLAWHTLDEAAQEIDRALRGDG